MKLPFLIMCVGVVVVALFAILRGKRSALILITLALLAFAAIALSKYRAGRLALTASRLDPWTPTADMQNRASLYPSLRAAAESVAAQLRAQIGDRIEVIAQPPRSPATSPASPPILSGDAPADVKQITADTIARNCAAGLHIRVDLIRAEAQSELKAAVSHPAIADAHAAFCDKPWADDQSIIPIAVNGDEQSLVAWSYQPCTSSDEALEQAQQAAAWRLAQSIYARHPDVPPDYSRDQQTLIARLLGDRLQRDHFTQRFDRDYAPIWRSAVLVDASPKVLDKLAAALRDAHVRAASAQRKPPLTIALVAAVIVLVYWLMNLLTKGYFQRPLLAAAVVLLIAGAIVAIVLI